MISNRGTKMEVKRLRKYVEYDVQERSGWLDVNAWVKIRETKKFEDGRVSR